MPDIALRAGSNPLSGVPVFDIELTALPVGAGTVARDVAGDDGLDTAVYLSLFTDARASVEDGAAPEDLRGWWGDEFGQIGSKLWLLLRSKATDEAVAFAQASAQEALQWLVEGGVAASVTVQAQRTGLYAIGIGIRIQRPDRTSKTFRYALNWASLEHA